MTRPQRIACLVNVAMSALTALVSSAQAASEKTPASGELIGDPFLNYFALGLLFFVVVVLFYGIIAIHDIPARIAHSRNHPHEDAIHAAGWVSLFTLHVLWPFLWIWAMAYQPDRGWGIHHPASDGPSRDDIENLRARLAALESRIPVRDLLESDAPPTVPTRKREVTR
jgi:hypothetical protein